MESRPIVVYSTRDLEGSHFGLAKSRGVSAVQGSLFPSDSPAESGKTMLPLPLVCWQRDNHALLQQATLSRILLYALRFIVETISHSPKP